MIEKIRKELRQKANPEKAQILQRFFKTGKGQYGEGDVFLGVMVPETRAIAKKYSGMNLKDVKKLLDSKIHEERLAGLLILVDKYQKGDKENIFNFYLKNSHRINNWDLVDVTSHKIVGDFLSDKPRDILHALAESENLWERRISIVSTFAFINKNDFKDSIKLAEKLLHDEHDLMHKAVGWMLREIGKKDVKELEKFLKKHYKNMPRTMLRYSIEKFPEKTRKKYLKGEF
jgi:3-methyladenine DNA glycosylase AlkD